MHAPLAITTPPSSTSSTATTMRPHTISITIVHHHKQPCLLKYLSLNVAPFLSITTVHHNESPTTGGIRVAEEVF
ncbi:putative inactive glucose-1-phosphate adenylyltransferase small [Sesbania bispinosa]|nr:putative inactive glucose-1-phosphate adenylyltransferase small [Sesbania bispinosa]